MGLPFRGWDEGSAWRHRRAARGLGLGLVDVGEAALGRGQRAQGRIQGRLGLGLTLRRDVGDRSRLGGDRPDRWSRVGGRLRGRERMRRRGRRLRGIRRRATDIHQAREDERGERGEDQQCAAGSARAGRDRRSGRGDAWDGHGWIRADPM